MKNIKAKLLDKDGSALAMTILVFAIVAVMSACLVLVVTSSQRMDLKTYRQEQAYIYAQAGLSMAFDYIETKAGEPGGTEFIQNYLDGREFDGTVSGMNFTDPSAIDNPTEMPGFTIKCKSKVDGTDNIFVVTSTSTYQGETASATRYFYFSAAADDDDAIDSLGDYHIKGSIYSVDGVNIMGDLRGRNIDIDGAAKYSSISALGTIKNNNSGLDIAGNVIAYNNIDFAAGASIVGNVQSVGGVRLSNMSVNPKNITAWGQTGDFSGNAVDIAISSVGDPANIDAQNVVVYSGKNARIGGTGGSGSIDLYGTVIVNGDLYITAAGIPHVYGNLIVKGNIYDSSGHLQVDGTKTFNYADEASFQSEAGSYSVTSVNAICRKIGYPREIATTIFPNVCNSPTLHPQRTTASGWSPSFVEDSVDFAQRQSDYKEVDLSNPTLRNYVNHKGGASADDGSEKLVTWYEDYTGSSMFININASGKYTNIQNLINTTSATANLVLYLDASSNDLDVCLDGVWDFTAKSWGQTKPQIIVNDGNGAHTVRLFLEKNTVLNMNGSTECLGVYDGSVSSIYNNVKNGQAVASYTNKDKTAIPRLYVFSDGGLAVDGDIDMAIAPQIKIAAGTTPGLFRGYIYSPYAYVEINSSSGPIPFVGKLECGDVVTGGNQSVALYYRKPEAEEYSAAIAGVYYPPNSAAGSGAGSVYSKRPSTRDKF